MDWIWIVGIIQMFFDSIDNIRLIDWELNVIIHSQQIRYISMSKCLKEGHLGQYEY